MKTRKNDEKTNTYLYNANHKEDPDKNSDKKSGIRNPSGLSYGLYYFSLSGFF